MAMVCLWHCQTAAHVRLAVVLLLFVRCSPELYGPLVSKGEVLLPALAGAGRVNF